MFVYFFIFVFLAPIFEELDLNKNYVAFTVRTSKFANVFKIIREWVPRLISMRK